MACPGMPAALSMTVATLQAGINIYLAYRELEIYKDQRDNLEPLTDTNIERGEKLHGFDHQVKALHASVYAAMHGLPTIDPCCEDAERVIPSIVSNQMWQYADALEEMSGYQAGLKQALYIKISRICGKAVAQQAGVFHRDQMMGWRSHASKNSVIAASGSPHNPHNVMTGVLANLAETTADRLNTSSQLFSAFSREAFRDIGFAIGLAGQQASQGGLFVESTPGLLGGAPENFQLNEPSNTQTFGSFPTVRSGSTSVIGNSSLFL